MESHGIPALRQHTPGRKSSLLVGLGLMLTILLAWRWPGAVMPAGPTTPTDGLYLADDNASPGAVYRLESDGGVMGFSDGTGRFGGAFFGDAGVSGSGQSGPGGAFSSIDGTGVDASSTNDVAVYATAGTIPLILITGHQAVVAYGEDNGIVAWGGQAGGSFTGGTGVSASGGTRGVHGMTDSTAEGAAGVFGESTNMLADGLRGQGVHGVHGIGFIGLLGEGDVGVSGEGMWAWVAGVRQIPVPASTVRPPVSTVLASGARLTSERACKAPAKRVSRGAARSASGCGERVRPAFAAPARPTPAAVCTASARRGCTARAAPISARASTATAPAATPKACWVRAPAASVSGV